MPTLFRFLATLAILGGLAFAGLFALATLVVPTDAFTPLAEPDRLVMPTPRISVVRPSGMTTSSFTGLDGTFLPFLTLAGRTIVVVTPTSWAPKSV